MRGTLQSGIFYADNRAPDIVLNDSGSARVPFLRDVDLDPPDRAWMTSG